MNKNTQNTLCAIGIASTALTAASAYFYKFAILKKKKYNNVWTSETRPQPYEKLRDCDKEKVQKGINFIFESKPEDITITSHDGLRLAGHYIEHENPNGLFIMVHGYRSSPTNDFSGAVLPIYNMGFSLLLIDQRAHGSSEGNKISFGVNESRDLVRWCQYAKKRFPNLPVVLDGVSMGASTIMMASGLTLPDNVKALICDCGYTSPAEICKVCLKKWYKLPPFPLFYTADLFIKSFAGFSLRESDAREALGKNKLPILLAHGTGDDFVPYYMAEENLSACTDCDAELFTVNGADHGMCYVIDPDGYTEKMKELFKKAGISWNEPEEPANNNE